MVHYNERDFISRNIFYGLDYFENLNNYDKIQIFLLTKICL